MENITISDIAQALGVSKTTVSRAISGKGRIGSVTRERVLSYIEEHNYTPNVIAKSLAQSKTYNIGVVMPEEFDIVDFPFFQSCLLGIQEVASGVDYDILLAISKPDDTSPLTRILTNRKVDGVILMRTFVGDRQCRLLAKQNVPFVTIGGTDVAKAVQVDQDHKNACKELTCRLLEKKFTRMALIGGDERLVVTRKRLGGFLEAFAEKGQREDKDLIFLNMNRPDLFEQRLEEVLQRRPDCIVCMDDAICARLLRRLESGQIRVPEQVQVASFYASPALLGYAPSIPTLSFDEKELGRAACSLLLEHIEGREVPALTTLRGVTMDGICV